MFSSLSLARQRACLSLFSRPLIPTHVYIRVSSSLTPRRCNDGGGGSDSGRFEFQSADAKIHAQPRERERGRETECLPSSLIFLKSRSEKCMTCAPPPGRASGCCSARMYKYNVFLCRRKTRVCSFFEFLVVMYTPPRVGVPRVLNKIRRV